MNGILVAALIIGIPALAFALWPLWSRHQLGLLPLPPDPREQLAEQKRQALRSLRELAFEHETGHISDDDYADLRARYEDEAASVLTELDRLGVVAVPEPAARVTSAPRASAWRHPLALAASAAALLVFGVGLGAGIVRYTTPDPPREAAMPGPSPMAAPDPGSAPGGGAGGGRVITPEILEGMLQAARASLFEGRYNEAIAAYQAVLKRQPKNIDAMTHLGLIVGIGGHADSALETFEKVLAIDPNYPPALLYRGQILYESKRDAEGAIRSWEKFLAVAPSGEDRERVVKMIAEAKAGGK